MAVHPLTNVMNGVARRNTSVSSTDVANAGGIKVMRAKYDFAVEGGAVSTIALNTATLPVGAVILGGYLDVQTIPTSGGSATIAVQAQAANDLVTATAYGSSPW